MSELYDEQEDARQAQRLEAERGRTSALGHRRTAGLAVALLFIASLLALAGVALWPRSGPATTPAAVVSLADLADAAPTTTTFDGLRYTIAFIAANPKSIISDGWVYAVRQGYSFNTPSGGVEFVMAGPQGGTALGYFDGGGEPNTGVRIVVAAADLTADGSALR